MVTSAASRQAQPHSGREIHGAYLTSVTLRPTYVKNTANSWAVGHPALGGEAGRSVQGHLQLHSKLKARWGSEELSKASKNATKLPALQCRGSSLFCKALGLSSGTLASLKVWQIPYSPYAGANMDAVVWALPKKIFSPSAEAPINVV